MMNSMTGFGRGCIEESGFGLTVEIKSVNHRYLDISVKMPRSLMSLEDRIRKSIQGKITRGKIDVFVTQNKSESQNEVASLNNSLADSYVKCLFELKERFGLKDDISVSLVARFPDVIALEQKEDDIEKIWEYLNVPLNEAIDMLKSMRAVEGKKLQENIEQRCAFIKDIISNIEVNADDVVADYRNKLNARLKELLGEIPVDQNKIASEVAVYADKSSIDEEIVRLNSHIDQMEQTLKLQEPVGRKLDFIVQEMNREANTIASKADNLQIINSTLSIKNEIEKIREQIQNIE